MQRHASHEPIPSDAKGASIAIGNFDGVHRGHQSLIAATRDAAARLHAPVGVMVFEPHPRAVLHPEGPAFRLQTSAQRTRALASLGVEHEFLVAFNIDLMAISAREFAEDMLAGKLAARHVNVGANFRYSRGRSADITQLQRDGAELGFGVTAIAPTLDANGERISSSVVREALQRGDAAQAALLLGRPWAIEGVVARGFARGREFGFPTLNIALGDYLVPRLGVYAVRVDIDGVKRPGVASIGVNPTFQALPAPLLEAHLFDFNADLYGRQVEVDIVAFLRPEAKFDSVETLKTQMAADSAQARALLA